MEKLDPHLRILLQERTPVAEKRGAERQARAHRPQAKAAKTAAAKALGMTFRALRYRIKKLGIE